MSVAGVTADIWGGLGGTQARRSAEPERDVEALFPCLPMSRSEEARMLEVVEMLKVLCESPPVPTISHYEERQENGTSTQTIRSGKY